MEKVKGMSITADGLGAVFDVPSDLLKTFLAGMVFNCVCTDISADVSNGLMKYIAIFCETSCI